MNDQKQASDYGIGLRKRDFGVKVNGSLEVLVKEYYYDVISGELTLYIIETKLGHGRQLVDLIINGLPSPEFSESARLATSLDIGLPFQLAVTSVVSAEISSSNEDIPSNEFVTWRVQCSVIEDGRKTS